MKSAIPNWINTNDLLQVCRPQVLSQDVSVRCYRNSETANNFFLHCEVARKLCAKLFHIFNEKWICPPAFHT